MRFYNPDINESIGGGIIPITLPTTIRTVQYTAVPLPRGFCPLFPASGSLSRHLPKTLRTLVALLKRIQPFIWWSVRLLWLQLTSPCPSGNTSVTVVSFVPQSGRHKWRHSRIIRTYLHAYARNIYAHAFRTGNRR